MSNRTTDKFNRIQELAEALGWTDLTEHEALMAKATHDSIRGAAAAIVDDIRAGKGLKSIEECTQRLSYADPRYEDITLHVQLLDGRLQSVAVIEFGKVVAKSMAAVVRYLEYQMMLAKHRD